MRDSFPKIFGENWQAAEAFITSTSVNVLPVVKIDDKLVGNGKVGEITKRLGELYNAHIYEQTGKIMA